jgi:hypothetical protein
VPHVVEVAFESINVSGPEPRNGASRAIHFLKWFRFQPVETALFVHAGFYETCLARRFGSAMISNTYPTLLMYSMATDSPCRGASAAVQKS